jgi:hypothetical protein
MLCACWLQVIKLLHDAFEAAGLNLYLRPYGCLPTGYECGIIEVSEVTLLSLTHTVLTVLLGVLCTACAVCCDPMESEYAVHSMTSSRAGLGQAACSPTSWQTLSQAGHLLGTQ